MATMIDLSVLIPTHNRAAKLRQCLDALRNQTLAPTSYEIIVVDDASTDETGSVLQHIEGVRTFRQPRNGGPAAARNVAVRAARGRYVLFIDDDILVSPTTLAQHLAAHREAGEDHVAILGKVIW